MIRYSDQARAFLKGARLIILISALLPCLASAREPVSSLEALPGYHWEIQPGTAPSVLALDLTSDRGVRTTVEYGWELPSGMRTVENRIDNDREVISPKPGRETWQPHPGQNTSAEEIFLNCLRSVGYTHLDVPYVEKTGDKVTFSTIEDFLAIARKQSPSRSFGELLYEIEADVNQTRGSLLDSLLHMKDGSTAEDLNLLSGMFDVVEPVEGKENGQTRIDGFSLLGLKQLESGGTRILDTLDALAATESFYPIQWYAENSSLPEDVRLAVISLITHNHRAENFFIEGVTLKYGVDRAWRTMKDINELYRKEQASLVALGERRLKKDPSLSQAIPDSNVSFLNHVNDWMVKMPFTNMWIPVARSYHYYGAFILSERLMERDLKYVPGELLKAPMVMTAVPAFGLLYKHFTADANERQESMITRIYTDGALSALMVGK